MKKLLLVTALLISAIPSVAATDRALWKLPKDTFAQTLRLRPEGKIAVYWSKEYNHVTTDRCLIDEKSGRLLKKNSLGYISGPNHNSTDVTFETINSRGQHAYLPYGNYRYDGDFLRLKIGKGYKILKNLPPLTYETYRSDSLHDLKFSPDGEVLKVLCQDRLYIVGAQTGKLLRVIRPSKGRWWSRENAVLSPDAFTILGMRDKMTIFSAKSGRIIKKYGVHVETSLGHEVEFFARVSFSPDGKSTYASDGGTTFEYPAAGGKLIWKGKLPEPEYFLSSPDGRFYLDYVDTELTNSYPIIKSVRTHKVVSAFPDIQFEFSMPENPIEFSSDSKSIYFVKDHTLWQRPFKTN